MQYSCHCAALKAHLDRDEVLKKCSYHHHHLAVVVVVVVVILGHVSQLLLFFFFFFFFSHCFLNRRFPEITGKDNLTVFSYSGRVKSPEWRRQLRRADLRQF